MMGLQLVLVAAVATLGGVNSVPVTQDCINCITNIQPRRDGWLRVSLKLVDDDLSRRSDYQQLQLESGEEQDNLSRWLYKDQELSRLKERHQRDQSDITFDRSRREPMREIVTKSGITYNRVRRAPMKKKNSKEQKRGGGKSKEKRPDKHSHERRRYGHEHKHKHSHDHKHRHSQEHQPRPKPGKGSKERTMAETTTSSTTLSPTTLSTTVSAITKPSIKTSSTTTPTTTTPSTTAPSTTTPLTTTRSITRTANTSQTTTTSTTTPTTHSTTHSTTNSPNTTESTTATSTTPSAATESNTTSPTTVSIPSTTTISTTTAASTSASQTPESTTPGSKTTSTAPRVRKRRSPAVLLSPSNEDISITSSEYKIHNKPESKHHKPSKQSTGKHNKEYSNIKQHGSKRKSPSDKVIDVVPNSNILHPLAGTRIPYQNDTIENEFLNVYKNFTSSERSSEEKDGIATTQAFVNNPVTQMPDSDEVHSNEELSSEDYWDILTTEHPSSIEDDSKSVEDVDDPVIQIPDSDEVHSNEELSTEDYWDIFTTDYPSSIEDDSQSVEDVDVSTEEPNKFSSNESYDYYSDEDTSTGDNIIVTTVPETLDSNESSSAEDDYQTKVDHKVNKSMESVETINIPEELTEPPDSMESVPDSIETGLTSDQPDGINSKESIEEAKNASAHIKSKESEEDDQED